MTRRPSDILVVDASILIAGARGRTPRALSLAIDRRSLMVTDRVVSETKRRIELGLKSPELLPIVDQMLEGMSLVYASELSDELVAAAIALKEAVASGNGSSNDAHILACAWITDADIWSYDRDFAGTGVASWSTPNLIRALLAEDVA